MLWEIGRGGGGSSVCKVFLSWGGCHYNATCWDGSHGPSALSRVWQHVKLSDVSLGTGPWYSVVADKDVKNPRKETKLPFACSFLNCFFFLFFIISVIYFRSNDTAAKNLGYSLEPLCIFQPSKGKGFDHWPVPLHTNVSVRVELKECRFFVYNFIGL